MLCSDLDLPTPDAIEQIITWAFQAGQIALRYFNNVAPQSKADQTFVTQADLQIQHFLSQQIRAMYPTHTVIGEEETRSKNAEYSSSVWTIDPIDGTTVFVQGLPGWGISIGLLYQGRPCFGLFYMPLLNDITYTTGHGEVYCNNRRLDQSVRRDWGAKGFLAISASAHRDYQFNVERTRAIGSIGASLVYAARGTAAGAFIPKARLWDLVAGAAILSGAGGELRYVSGRIVDYLELLDGRLAPEPILAGHPDFQPELRAAIGPHQEQ